MNRKPPNNHSWKRELIDRFPDLRVLVVGDVMLDVYEFCRTGDSKPIDSEKAGKRAYKAQETIKVLGGAGNVAANLASLDVRTALVGVTGDDEHYFKIRDLADGLSIRHGLIRDESRPTTTKVRLYLDDDYLLRRDTESTGRVDGRISAALVKEVLRALPETDAVVLSDYDKGVFTAENAGQIIGECRLHEIPVVVDFKPGNRAAFAGADIIAPNASEAAALIGGFSTDRLETDCRRLHDALGCRNTVVTLGEQGLCGFGTGGFFHVSGHRVVPVDRVGCGDTVRAGLAIGAALGLPLREAGELANDAATVIVQKPATSVLSRRELRDFVSRKCAGETQSEAVLAGREGEPSE
ncbi:MAG: PfkB family carbohydrate kinase [Gemmatimonadetes bacterium]|nr:PfkB family carbohydrate kinase [Gemmatimonadota bacterium]